MEFVVGIFAIAAIVVFVVGVIVWLVALGDGMGR